MLCAGHHAAYEGHVKLSHESLLACFLCVIRSEGPSDNTAWWVP